MDKLFVVAFLMSGNFKRGGCFMRMDEEARISESATEAVGVVGHEGVVDGPRGEPSIAAGPSVCLRGTVRTDQKKGPQNGYPYVCNTELCGMGSYSFN